MQKLNNQTVDTLLLVYNSSSSFLINYQSWEVYEMTASIFSNIGAKTVDFAYIDVANSTTVKAFVVTPSWNMRNFGH